MHALFLALTLIGLCLFWFGGLFRALMFVTAWSDRLALPYWQILAIGTGAIALFVSTFTFHKLVRSKVLIIALPCISLSVAILAVSAYAEHHRKHVTAAFKPDMSIENTFLESLRNAPRDFQVFLHGAALKDCVPYAWSYREFDYYELPLTVAHNVLPQDWITTCNLRTWVR